MPLSKCMGKEQHENSVSVTTRRIAKGVSTGHYYISGMERSQVRNWNKNQETRKRETTYHG